MTRSSLAEETILMKVYHYVTRVALLAAFFFPPIVTPAHAQAAATLIPASAEEASQNGEVFSFLQEYFSALAQGEVAKLAIYHPSLTPEQLETLHDYFAHTVRDLRIRLEHVHIQVAAATATVAFYRTDRFIDRLTGRPVEKSIQLSSGLVRGASGWRLAGLDQIAFALSSGKTRMG